jgi:hypothetical protein
LGATEKCWIHLDLDPNGGQTHQEAIEHIGKAGGGHTAAESTIFSSGSEKRTGRWRRLGASQLDSLDNHDPGDKAELLVVSAKRGMVPAAGRRRPEAAFLVVLPG